MALKIINNFLELVPIFANNLKLRHEDKFFKIMPPAGEGFCWAEILPCGITIMVSDTLLKQPCNLGAPSKDGNYFILQFNEELPVELDGSTNSSAKRSADYHSWVKLSQSNDAEEIFFSSGIRLKSIKIFFAKYHLSSFLSEDQYDKVVNELFPSQITEKTLAPIATEYRIMLDELLVETIQQPLRLNYLQNRVLLLIEKYLEKISAQKEPGQIKVKRNENEAIRLMKVEALLVKNFSVAPPTIDELSRISAMSPTKLKNDFKAQYGMPIYEYYQKNRMLKAKNLLVLGKYSIKEVGKMVGYSNLSHFASKFKKEFGHLPSELSTKDGVLNYDE